jgi:probable addiction module antidote protein
MSMPLKLREFDPSEHLGREDAQMELLADAFETRNGAYIADALGIVARARGMTGIAKEAGVTREALYRALREDGDPKLTTLLGVLKALGVKLKVEAAE